MLTLKQCRKLLDADSRGLTDDEVIKIRNWTDKLADSAIKIVMKSENENSVEKKIIKPRSKTINSKKESSKNTPNSLQY